MTCGYSIKLLSFVFIQTYAGNKQTITHPGHFTMLEAIILSFLALCSFSTGFYFRDQFIGFGSDYLAQSASTLTRYTDVIVEFLAPLSKVYPLLGSGMVILILVLSLNSKIVQLANTNFATAKCYYNEISNR